MSKSDQLKILVEADLSRQELEKEKIKNYRYKWRVVDKIVAFIEKFGWWIFIAVVLQGIIGNWFLRT